MSTLISGNPTF